MAVTMRADLLTDQEWSRLEEGLRLSPRQTDIVRWILRGASDKQIAWELGISLPTVRTHVGRMFRRFDLSDRVELVIYLIAYLRYGCDKDDPRRIEH